MTFVELMLTAVALSMDAFAVSTCKGLGMRKLNWKHAMTIGLFFGGFQAAMPLLGWLLGRQFEKLITGVDHWIVFALLAIIGGKMIYDSRKGGEEEACACEDKLNLKELVGLSFATSIDALAVGISFAFLKVQIVPSVVCIGVTTCLLSIGGVWIGQRFGAKYQNKATLAGGVVLVLIGLRILLEHLGVFG
ncbi:MAG: manganese efflux pump MntP family protein [Eubacteriales bacterium]|nr:manganese efflux pump MntP family protein [Eubacteriales bacterium]